MTVGLNGKTVYGGHGIGVEADITIDELDLTDLEMIVLPGGLGGVASIQASAPAMDALQFAWENNKYVAAICAAPSVLAQKHITDNKKVVCYPGFEPKMGNATPLTHIPSVQDGNVITGASAGCAVPFALALISALKGEAAAKEIEKQIVIR